MGIVVPLWIWLPVVLWILLRRERRIREMWRRQVEIQQGRGLDMLGGQLGPPDLRIASGVVKERKESEMRGVWLVAAMGLLLTGFWSWEPKPSADAVVAPAVAAIPVAPAAPVAAAQPQPVPPGMVYDPVLNSYHYQSRQHP